MLSQDMVSYNRLSIRHGDDGAAQAHDAPRWGKVRCRRDWRQLVEEETMIQLKEHATLYKWKWQFDWGEPSSMLRRTPAAALCMPAGTATRTNSRARTRLWLRHLLCCK